MNSAHQHQKRRGLLGQTRPKLLDSFEIPDAYDWGLIVKALLLPVG
jgi:hypothetical protein